MDFHLGVLRTNVVPNDGRAHDLPPDRKELYPLYNDAGDICFDLEVGQAFCFKFQLDLHGFGKRLDTFSIAVAVKIFVGDINVITGEKESEEEKLLLRSQIGAGRTTAEMQNYMPVELFGWGQRRLDGFKNGFAILQFIAQRMGAGRTVEEALGGTSTGSLAVEEALGGTSTGGITVKVFPVKAECIHFLDKNYIPIRSDRHSTFRSSSGAAAAAAPAPAGSSSSVGSVMAGSAASSSADIPAGSSSSAGSVMAGSAARFRERAYAAVVDAPLGIGTGGQIQQAIHLDRRRAGAYDVTLVKSFHIQIYPLDVILEMERNGRLRDNRWDPSASRAAVAPVSPFSLVPTSVPNTGYAVRPSAPPMPALLASALTDNPAKASKPSGAETDEDPSPC
jgi:hypothetical protein